jgi:hypothetical protein
MRHLEHAVDHELLGCSERYGARSIRVLDAGHVRERAFSDVSRFVASPRWLTEQAYQQGGTSRGGSRVDLAMSRNELTPVSANKAQAAPRAFDRRGRTS